MKSCDCYKIIKKIETENLILKEDVLFLHNLVKKLKEELKMVHYDPEIDKYF